MDQQQELTHSIPRLRRSSDALNRGQALFFVFSMIIFLGVIASFGVLYFFSGRLEAQNADLKEQIASVENELDPELLKRLMVTSATLENGQKLLSNHVIASNVFEFLQQSTHPKVEYRSFTYSYIDKKVNLSTIADSFAVLARQIGVYESSDGLSSVAFSGLNTDPDNNIAFNLSLLFKPSLVHYKPVQ
ncbi:MAG: hypothetical protein A3H69_01445 [Candidatus Sungbacteria bacterium RIFCSPLOWO2_02_FULL_47_9]|uniref:Uncharacterized protein n=1 Tax=Candidatus Sungbacteria bacterium RIFCSPHIGHO2_01_FULL_47_32 TaxID=1802264 RepID=A0A1G2K338_9BACT|nr:MAG: hypothetical protein UX72_C0008G0003 [Parcubacteria group bacterium GW2011_GWA2_47_10]OGZ93849.1 MAG: hypothetical protein A2633_04425 [Candidatus Sungbacteria bacterium RIFCSPHIGHO2_01_FULL_47_32]OHA04720.1 MAG: hypothetical protein A3A28_00905 [Candidatus Sungbacteria bacterium RIFCSPLOWO2_01_FULL_47_32]OHA09631.1 MAG: hypothetical protein A3H69_01445 [Candidatus Sungbacteria bacterium RIFCSPLOWO2_02_FULL_47_9]